MDDSVLIGADLEHLESAHQNGLGQGNRVVSFGTDFWTEDAGSSPETFPIGATCYIYGATRGLSESVPEATWISRFVAYRRAESFAPGELDATRPPTTLVRRRHDSADDEREPEWAAYIMLTDLRPLDSHEWIPLRDFSIRGRRFGGTVVRHPLLVSRIPRR